MPAPRLDRAPDPVPPFTTLTMGHDFVEAPRVLPDGTLWCSDLAAGGIIRVRPGGPVERFATGRQWIGGIVVHADGTLLLGGRGGFARFDPADGALTPLPLPIDDGCELCINDMEAAPDGGLFGGTIDFAAIMGSGAPPAPGTLFHLAADGRLTLLRRDVIASNGLGISPCGTWLYHSETGRGVWRYPLGRDGLPGAGALIVAMEDSDGLVVDSAGGIWVAGWASSELRHYTAEGALTRRIRLPFAHVVSLAFGGADLHTLFVSTGGNAAHPGQGGVIALTVDPPGQRDHLARIDVAAMAV